MLRRLSRATQALLLALLLTPCAPAWALKIEPDRGKPWRLQLSGEIVPGDAERLIRQLLESAADKPQLLTELVLDSNGGNLAESFRLASMVYSLHLDTSVKSGGKCQSACFFVFIAGDRRLIAERPGGDRPGRIGLHRPYLGGDALKQGDPASGMGRQQEEMAKTAEYLRRQGVPLRLIDEMMSHASNDIYWLNDEDLWLLGEFGAGLEEVLIARCGYDKRSATPAYERLLASLPEPERSQGQAKLAATAACISSTRASFDARREAFLARLKTGWRPWTVKP